MTRWQLLLSVVLKFGHRASYTLTWEDNITLDHPCGYRLPTKCNVTWKLKTGMPRRRKRFFADIMRLTLPTFSHPSTLNRTYLVWTLRRDSLTQKKSTFSKYRKTRLSFKKKSFKNGCFNLNNGAINNGLAIFWLKNFQIDWPKVCKLK